jgi:DNA-directed RNA polymerase specialized sigma24 family protein
MFDVKVNGKVIARASTEVESEIYKLDFEGLESETIADILHIPIHIVNTFTKGYATR